MTIPRGKAGLARAAGTKQSQQPRPLAEMLADHRQVTCAADERVGFARQVVRDVAHRPPQVAAAHDPVRLVAVGRGPEATLRRHTEFEDRDRLLDTFETVVPMATDFHRDAERRRIQRLFGARRQQCLPAARHRHDPRREGKRKAFDLGPLGTERDVVVGAFTQHDRTHVHSGTRSEPHFCHLRVILQRIARSISGSLEQHEQAV